MRTATLITGAILAAAALAVAAYTLAPASRPAAAPAVTAPGGLPYTADEVAERLDLEPVDGGLALRSMPTGCHVAVVLIGAASVRLYSDAGDPVAMNPDGTIGLKVTDADTARCVRDLSRALEGLR